MKNVIRETKTWLVSTFSGSNFYAKSDRDVLCGPQMIYFCSDPNQVLHLASKLNDLLRSTQEYIAHSMAPAK